MSEDQTNPFTIGMADPGKISFPAEIERLRSSNASLVAYAQSLEKQISVLHKTIGEMEAERRSAMK